MHVAVRLLAVAVVAAGLFAASEAPAELTFYLPEKKAFCGAEVVSHNLHNLYTLRGAKVRDALAALPS